MRVVDIKVTPVTVPMEAPLRWSMGVETGTTRGIIELFTDEGIIGIGETYGGNAMEHAVETAKQYIVGLDPLEIGVLQHRLGVFRIGYETSVPAVVRAGIEMAFLDAAGKALKKPIYSLLGGKTRDRIETSAYIFYRYAGNNGCGGEASPEAILERTLGLVQKYGFTAQIERWSVSSRRRVEGAATFARAVPKLPPALGPECRLVCRNLHPIWPPAAG